jgi:hypothetical protein
MMVEAVAVLTRLTAVGVPELPLILARAVAVAIEGRSVRTIVVPVGTPVVGESLRKLAIINTLYHKLEIN